MLHNDVMWLNQTINNDSLIHSWSNWYEIILINQNIPQPLNQNKYAQIDLFKITFYQLE
jgi:hypothetical protein